MKKLFLTIMAMAIAIGSYAIDEPKWKLDLDKKAEWLKITSAGIVIVATNTSLVAIDPDKQAKLYEIKGATIADQEKFQEIDGTSFAIYESTSLTSIKAQTTIIDYFTGRIIYNSGEANVSILNKKPLLEIGSILLEIKQDKKAVLTLVNIQSGKESWRMDLPDRKTGFNLGALKQSIKSMLDAEPVADIEGNILFPDDKKLHRLDARTGAKLWTKEYEKSVGRLNFSDDGTVVYVGSGKFIGALSLSDGKDVWKNSVKINGEFQMFIPTVNNKMYCVTSSQIQLIDQVTGSLSWKKPATLDQPFIELRFTNKGIVVMGGDDKTSTFDYIGFDGNSFWKRSYRTDKPVVNFAIVSKGVLFANAEEANMIDLNTGDDSIWKKRIKLKGSPITFLDEKIGLIYADQKLYRVNLSDVTYQLIVEDIKFKGSDEDVQKIEVRENGYLLRSQQNAWLISPDGKVIYSKYYAPASIGTAGKILGVMGQVYATVDNLEVTQDPNKPNTFNIQRSKKGDDIVHGIGDVIANRKNSFQSQEALYIMTRIEDGATKRTGMVKLNKNTGNEEGRILLKTLEPIYQVDYATGNLFVIVNGSVSGSEFSCFGL
ncbi:MAG TPA: PQQ-binding-like beta-propeller repeat protein [Cyclobacteriaceae bacterium]|nr:PQQ-binding-like beta-propeller repeat protein [Cyclobacteriaceae bacterium]